MTLYDQFNRPVKSTKAPEKRMLAAAPIYDSWRDYVTSGLTPQRLASIFKEADAGDVRRQAELFDQIEEKDGHLLGEKSKRQNIILDVEFQVKPASEDPRDVKVAEFVQDYLDNMTEFEDVLVGLQDAVGKGFSALEIGWDVSEGQALPDKLEFIEQKRFLFADMQGVLHKHPRLISDEEPMGTEVPAWKMLFHRYGGKSGHPTRSGIYRVCTWMYLFKNYALKDWVIFCEIFGMPLRLGKYPPGASKNDKDALITAISSLGSDAAGIISNTTDIEFIKGAATKASGDLYSSLASFSNREMSKALLGQTLSAEVGEKGSYAAAKVHDGVRVDLLRADSRAAAGTLRHQLIRPIVGFNFGWDTPVPKYEAPWEEEEDLVQKAEWMGDLMDRGVEMPLPFVRSEFNIPEPEKGEAVVGTLPAATPSAAQPTRSKIVAKSNPVDAETTDLVTDKLETEGRAAIESMAEAVRELVAKANTLEEVRDGLADLYADHPSGILAGMIQLALMEADLAGRYEVINDE